MTDYHWVKYGDKIRLLNQSNDWVCSVWQNGQCVFYIDTFMHADVYIRPLKFHFASQKEAKEKIWEAIS